MLVGNVVGASFKFTRRLTIINPLSDYELILLLRERDEKAFDYLVSTYQVRMFNVCLSVLQNAADAEDITQEVFVEVYKSIINFKGESKVSTWMYRIAMTKSLDFLRAKKRKKRFALVITLFSGKANEPRFHPPNFIHPGIELENKELSMYLFKAIDALPEKQKMAFTLHKIEGLSYQQISEVMETTVSSVESLLFRARQNLKDLLSEYYNNSF